MKMDWATYATAYDQMAELNPAYQELLATFTQAIKAWPLADGDTLADLGAGTGNFSTILAGQFPRCEIVHVDFDEAMNRQAAAKAGARRLENIRHVTSDLATHEFPPSSQAGVVSVHALYTLANPTQMLRRMHDWLRPGGQAFLCDFGRSMNVADWRSFLFQSSRRQHGLFGTLRKFWRGRVVAEANHEIARRQSAGEFWTHSHAEFVAAVVQAGFEVSQHEQAYRGYSDVVICRRPYSLTPKLSPASIHADFS